MNDDGGATFPIYGGEGVFPWPGMTLRDYAAIKAMQGFAADPTASWSNGVQGMAKCAYEWADAMLAAREAS